MPATLVSSSSYRLVRGFRLYLARKVFPALTAPCSRVDETFTYFGVSRWETPLWQLVQARPAHLLPPDHESWEALMLSAVDSVIDDLIDGEEDVLRTHTWGNRNVVALRHPLSQAVPALGRWLDVPGVSLPGDVAMPRVQTPQFGASERMIVSPGREEDGLFHMPGGQSGHPFSPYYRKGHEAWVAGEATPLLPGPPLHTLTLSP